MTPEEEAEAIAAAAHYIQGERDKRQRRLDRQAELRAKHKSERDAGLGYRHAWRAARMRAITSGNPSDENGGSGGAGGSLPSDSVTHTPDPPF